MGRGRRAVGFGTLGLLAAGAAYALHLVSAAHGHGMASPDRQVFGALLVLAGASGLAALGSLRGPRR